MSEVTEAPSTAEGTRPAPTAAELERNQRYWRTNLTVVGVLLAIWALVSYGAGLVFHPFLDQFHIPGTYFPVGFWFAQQGAILVFVLLIAAYVLIMDRIEKQEGLAD